MEEENKEVTVEANPQEDDKYAKYLQKIEELQKNSVPKAEADKLKQENKALFDAIVNGRALAEQEATAESSNEPSIQELRNKLATADENLNDLEYVSTALDLRRAVMAIPDPTGRKNRDPFVPHSTKYAPSPQDFENARLTADALQECVDRAAGDLEVFKSEIRRRFI